MEATNQTREGRTESYYRYLDHLVLELGDRAFVEEVIQNIERSDPVSIFSYAVDRCEKGMAHGSAALWLWEQAVELCKPETPKPYYPFVSDGYLCLSERRRRRNASEAGCATSFRRISRV